MNQPASSADTSSPRADGVLAELFDQFSMILERGDSEELSAFFREHPAEEEHLRRMLPTMRALGTFARAPQSGLDVHTGGSPTPRTLGDFRIIQEIGRGGMGVVYLAEQTSLGRTVALKILPLAAVLDPRQVQRFKNEVRAAATLDHPNIVSVYSVGEERGVHYYAMQHVHGQSLASVVCDLRLMQPGATDGANSGIGQAAQLLCGESRSPATNRSPSTVTGNSTPRPRPNDTARNSAASSRTSSHSSTEYYRRVATLGIQAARALDYAHQHGVVHRDIKPGNLLLDASGTLFVTDFGLALIENDAEMSLTGEVVGTLRYMSPEQARGDRPAVNHRADIYSLGATLYELLILEPPFRGDNRHQVLEQVIHVEPPTLRSVDKKIPVDLETVVFKAMAKAPEDRYATAEDLAHDLECFLEHRPILAKRRSVYEASLKWMTRHQSFVLTTAAFLVLAAASLVISTVMVTMQKQRADRMFQQTQDLLYAADVRLAGEALATGNVGQALERLERHVPKHDEADRRGFAWRYLASQVNREKSVWQAQADGDVCWVEFTRDGTMLVSGHDSGRILIWSVPTGELLDALVGHTDTVQTLSISADGVHLISGDDAGRLLLWNLKTRRLVRVVTQVPESIQSTIFAPDGKSFAFAAGRIVQIWTLDADRPERTLSAAAETINALDISPDGTLLAAASHDEHVYLCELDSGAVTAELKLSAPVFSVAFTPDGRRVIAGTQIGEISVWDRSSATWQSSWRSHAANVYHLTCSSDGRYLLSAGKDTTVRVRDLELDEDFTVYQGHGARAFCAQYSPDGESIASCGRDGCIRIWHNRRKNFRRITVFPVSGADASFSSDARTAAVATYWQTFFVNAIDGSHHNLPMSQFSGRPAWMTLGNQLITTGATYALEPLPASLSPAVPDGDDRLVGAMGPSQRVVRQRPAVSDLEVNLPRLADFDGLKAADIAVDWNQNSAPDRLTSSGGLRQIRWHELSDENPYQRAHVVLEDLDVPLSSSLGYLDDDRQLDLVVATFGDHTIWWYPATAPGHVAAARVLSHDVTEACRVLAVDVDDDGRCDVLAAGHKGKVCWFRNLGQGTFSSEMIVDQRAVGACELDFRDVDGDTQSDIVVALDDRIVWYRQIESGRFEGSPRVIDSLENAHWLRPLAHDVIVWNPETNDIVFSFPSRSAGVNSSAYASHLKQFAIGSAKELRLFDQHGELQRRFEGFAGRVSDVQYSTDERYLAMATGDDVLLCDTRKWTLGKGVGHNNTVNRVRFSPRGDFVVSISNDQSARVWTVPELSQQHVLLGHRFPLTTLCFSPDGRRLATADGGGEVAIWDMTTGQQLLSLDDIRGAEVLDLAFRNESELVAIASEPNVATYLCVWKADP